MLAVLVMAGLGSCGPAARIVPVVCPATPTTDQPAQLIDVPAGRFLMGDDVYGDEGPPRLETVAAFRIDATEVTNARFARFVEETGYVTVAERPVDPAQYPGMPAAAAGRAVAPIAETRCASAGWHANRVIRLAPPSNRVRERAEAKVSMDQILDWIWRCAGRRTKR